MGLHCGFLAAPVDWPRLRTEFVVGFGPLDEAGTISAEEWLALPPRADGIDVAVTKTATYVGDPRMVFTIWPDWVVRASKDLDCLLASGGAETVSGTYWLIVADRGEIKRLHWNVLATTTQPFDLGKRLSTEEAHPLEDPDGNGVLAAFASLGFDEKVLQNPSTAQRFLSNDAKFPEEGPFGQQITEHQARYKRAGSEDWTKNIDVVKRGDGGFDLRAQPPSPSRKKPFLRRWLGRG
jgi:hypothetical protein